MYIILMCMLQVCAQHACNCVDVALQVPDPLARAQPFYVYVRLHLTSPPSKQS